MYSSHDKNSHCKTGLLSLTVTFFRIDPADCTHDDEGNPISLDWNEFLYGTTCGLPCSARNGPHSPLREGSANDINVVPIPHILTFGTATLLAAACCIPAILSVIFMWTKILEINWRTRFGDGLSEEKRGEVIDGTNGATEEGMRGVNRAVRKFLSAVEIPVFSAAILAILVIGERNFWSPPMRYQTEPLTTIGRRFCRIL